MEQMIGKMLDRRYELLEILGSGGMSVVYKAKCHRLNRMVAVKILKNDLAGDEEFRRRFHDESQAVAMLSHPNIVTIYDVSCSESEYIVMEFVNGVTLKQYIVHRGKLDWRESLHFIIQVMKGLSHAHSRNIIHRDVKPQNIMVLRDGSVKVMDFGIACLSDSSHTITQEAIGSVHYMSPEQAKGNRPDARSDIYSAGVVLYEMLTSRLPFEGDSAVSVALQHLSSVPLSPRDLNPDVPEALELICMKAMASDISRRYETADAMLADLEEFRRNPETDLSFTAEDIYGKKEESEEEEQEERKGGKHGLFVAGILALCAVAVFGLWRVILSSFPSEPIITEFAVPNLIGMTIEEAERLPAVAERFTIRQIGSRASTEYDVGEILEQSPLPEKKVKNNFEISVFVSTGEVTAPMINIIGEEYRMGKIILNRLEMGLQYKTVEEFSDDYETGHIIRTIPAEGEILRPGDEITLIISKGKETIPVSVPAFVNLPIGQVREQVEQMGLIFGGIREEYSRQAAGMVLEQSIAATTVVNTGTEISFVVSKGSDPNRNDEGGDIGTRPTPVQPGVGDPL